MFKFLKPKSYPLFDRDKNPKFPDLDFFNHYAAADWKIPTDRNTGFRGPWHDITCQIFGTSARDVARHFRHWVIHTVHPIIFHTTLMFCSSRQHFYILIISEGKNFSRLLFKCFKIKF